jgi:hypothetical protein
MVFSSYAAVSLCDARAAVSRRRLVKCPFTMKRAPLARRIILKAALLDVCALAPYRLGE